MEKALHQFPKSIMAVFEQFTPAELAALMVEHAANGDALAAKWIEGVVDGDAKSAKTLIRRAVDEAGPLKMSLYPRAEGAQGVRFEHVYADESAETRAAVLKLGRTEEEADRVSKAPRYAHAFLRIVDAGLIERIKRCALDDCRAIFFGDVRAEFCSKSCGTKYRVRKLRGGGEMPRGKRKPKRVRKST